jgi:hypothetical protein
MKQFAEAGRGGSVVSESQSCALRAGGGCDWWLGCFAL